MFVFCCELFFVCSFLVGTICVVVLKTVYRWPLGCKHPGARRQIQRFRCWVIFLAPLIVQYLIWRVCFFFMCFFSFMEHGTQCLKQVFVCEFLIYDMIVFMIVIIYHSILVSLLLWLRIIMIVIIIFICLDVPSPTFKNNGFPCYFSRDVQ